MSNCVPRLLSTSQADFHTNTTLHYHPNARYLDRISHPHISFNIAIKGRGRSVTLSRASPNTKACPSQPPLVLISCTSSAPVPDLTLTVKQPSHPSITPRDEYTASAEYSDTKMSDPPPQHPPDASISEEEASSASSWGLPSITRPDLDHEETPLFDLDRLEEFFEESPRQSRRRRSSFLSLSHRQPSLPSQIRRRSVSPTPFADVFQESDRRRRGMHRRTITTGRLATPHHVARRALGGDHERELTREEQEAQDEAYARHLSRQINNGMQIIFSAERSTGPEVRVVCESPRIEAITMPQDATWTGGDDPLPPVPSNRLPTNWERLPEFEDAEDSVVVLSHHFHPAQVRDDPREGFVFTERRLHPPRCRCRRSPSCPVHKGKGKISSSRRDGGKKKKGRSESGGSGPSGQRITDRPSTLPLPSGSSRDWWHNLIHTANRSTRASSSRQPPSRPARADDFVSMSQIAPNNGYTPAPPAETQQLLFGGSDIPIFMDSPPQMSYGGYLTVPAPYQMTTPFQMEPSAFATLPSNLGFTFEMPLPGTGHSQAGNSPAGRSQAGHLQAGHLQAGHPQTGHSDWPVLRNRVEGSTRSVFGTHPHGSTTAVAPTGSGRRWDSTASGSRLNQAGAAIMPASTLNLQSVPFTPAYSQTPPSYQAPTSSTYHATSRSTSAPGPSYPPTAFPPPNLQGLQTYGVDPGGFVPRRPTSWRDPEDLRHANACRYCRFLRCDVCASH